MDDKLSLAGAGLGFSGWFCALLTRFLPMWSVSGAVDNTTDTVPLHWDGVWIHWGQQGDGALHCHLIQSALHLSGSFRSWKALLVASICIGFAANVLYVAGRLKFPKRVQVKVVSGVLFALSGLLMLVVSSWVSHRTSEPLKSTIELKRDWGAALYTGWIGTVLLVVGGGTLIITCCLSPPGEVYRAAATPSAPEAADPFNTATYRQDDSPYYPTTRPF